MEMLYGVRTDKGPCFVRSYKIVAFEVCTQG